MKLFVCRETKKQEARVALIPRDIKELIKKGHNVAVETGAGEGSGHSDEDYKEAGATIEEDGKKGMSNADGVLRINPFDPKDIANIPKGSLTISFVYALSNNTLVETARDQGVSMISMDAVPRISRAQKMDALSSQANLAGYKTVIMAANHLKKIFPLMMTAAGTIKPVSVVVFGAGVAGLQAIATAKRLGANVEVSDVRPETKEQVESVGGKFIEVESEEEATTEGGYVKEISEEYLKKQQEVVAGRVAKADVVITTAQVPGKKAPLLVSEDMVKSMKKGSVIVDMATEQGGNCSLSEKDKVVEEHGVTIIGESDLASHLPINASEVFSKNITEMIAYITGEEGGIDIDTEDDILKGALITHKEGIVNPEVANSITNGP